MKRIKIKTRGMTCSSCEVLIASSIKKLPGIAHAKVDYVSETGFVEFDETKTTMQEIFQAVEKAGYWPSLMNEERLGDGSRGSTADRAMGNEELAELKQKFIDSEISEEEYLVAKNNFKLNQLKKSFVTGEISDEEYITRKKEISEKISGRSLSKSSSASSAAQNQKEPEFHRNQNQSVSHQKHHDNRHQKHHEQKNKQKQLEEKSEKLAESYTKPWYAHASFYIVGIVVILLGVYLIISGPVVPKYPELSATSSLWIVFLIGLMTGFHCIGMC